MKKILVTLLIALSLSSVSFADESITIVDTQTNYSELTMEYIYHSHPFDGNSTIDGVRCFDSKRNISVTFYFTADFSKVKEYFNARYFYDYVNDDLVILYVGEL